MSDAGELNALMDAEAYQAFIAADHARDHLPELRARKPDRIQLLLVVRYRSAPRRHHVRDAGDLGRQRPRCHRPVGVRPARGAVRGHPGAEVRRSLCPRRRHGHPRAPSRVRHLPRRHHRLATSRRVRRDGPVPGSDVGSLNGTYINRDRVDEQELHEGDELQSASSSSCSCSARAKSERRIGEERP